MVSIRIFKDGEGAGLGRVECAYERDKLALNKHWIYLKPKCFKRDFGCQVFPSSSEWKGPNNGNSKRAGRRVWWL